MPWYCFVDGRNYTLITVNQYILICIGLFVCKLLNIFMFYENHNDSYICINVNENIYF